MCSTVKPAILGISPFWYAFASDSHIAVPFTPSAEICISRITLPGRILILNELADKPDFFANSPSNVLSTDEVICSIDPASITYTVPT
jgi:hypothetical protein